MNFSFNSFSTAVTTFVAVSALSLTSIATHAGEANLALGKPSTASSIRGANLISERAFDGAGSRWASLSEDIGWIQVDLGTTYTIHGVTLNWSTAYAKAYEIQTSSDGSNWKSIYKTTAGKGGIEDVLASGVGRYVRMYGTTAATTLGYSLAEFEVYGEAYVAPVEKVNNTANVALGKTVTTSSNNGANLRGDHAVDGSYNSRWISKPADANWIAIDLGATYQIGKVTLNWDAGYGSAYDIQISTDGSNWKNIYSTNAGKGGVEQLNAAGSGRYVRMNGRERGTSVGYALKEFEVFGSLSGATPAPSSSSSSSKANSSASSTNSSQASSKSSVSSSSSSKASNSSSSSSSVNTGDDSTVVNGEVTLEWFTPTQRENGDYLELDEIGGYEIRYKLTSSDVFTSVIVDDASTESYSLGRLSGEYEFEIATFDKEGIYSEFVNVVPN